MNEGASDALKDDWVWFFLRDGICRAVYYWSPHWFTFWVLKFQDVKHILGGPIPIPADSLINLHGGTTFLLSN